MIDESLNDLSKRLKLISDIRQQVNLIHNLYENKRILGKSNFKKVHTVNKGESSRGFITLGKGMEYIPPVDSLKSAHSIRRRASSIIQDYDSRLLPDVIRKPFNFFPHNKYDFVGKRQEFVKTAAGQSTAIVPYTPSFTDELSAKYGMHGPQVPNPDDRYAEQQKERRENKYRYARLQVSRRREERERLYSQAPWMKSVIQSGIINKKNIPHIAKAVDKLTKLPGASGFIKNPLLSAYSAIQSIAAVETESAVGYAKGRTSELAFGSPDQNFIDAARGHGLGREQAVSIFQKLQGMYGPATMEVLKSIASTTKGMPGWARQLSASAYGFDANSIAIADSLLSGKPIDTIGDTASRATIINDWVKLKKAQGETSTWLFHSLFENMPGTYTDSQIKAMEEELKYNARGKGNKFSMGFWNGVYETSGKIDEMANELPTPSNTNIGGDNNVSSNINTPINITVYGNADPQEIASVTAESVNRVIGRRANMDNISSGVMA